MNPDILRNQQGRNRNFVQDHVKQKFNLGDVVKAKITRYCDGIDMVGYVQGMIIQMNGHKNGYDHVMYITVQFHDGNKFREVNQDDCEKVG